MAYPNFSEFTFGYAVVRQIEDGLGGRMAVPTFPTQPDEFDKGYDVDFLSHGIPLFIQLKRSEVLRRKSCREYKDNKASLRFPIYRMHLHEHHDFKQHLLMQDLQSSGNVAVYCTSAVPNKNELDQCYADGRVFDASAVFLPSEITLPSLNERHHVSFSTQPMRACVYSSDGEPFQPAMGRFEDLLDKLRSGPKRSTDGEIEHLKRVDEDFTHLGAEKMAARQRARHGLERKGGERDDDDMLSDGMTRVVELGPFGIRDSERSRIGRIESVVKRVALHAYFEMDALLVSVSRKAIAE